MLRKSIFLLILVSMFLVGDFGYSEVKPIVDDSDKQLGVVHITYKKADAAVYKVLVMKDDKKISYPFKADGVTESFPLQMGNGSYKVGLLKNVGGTKYAYVSSKTIVIDLKDPNVVYLNSIQNVNWNEENESIVFGRELIKPTSLLKTRIKTLYDYVVKNVAYDYDKIPTLTADYVPNIDETYADLKGICYDYSALFASIHRSQGIPTRLVKGYSKFVDGYHAWNEIYINGDWYIIDSTVDATLTGAKVYVRMYKSTGDYTKVYDY
ncbi:MAG: transglutaminase domain-containing protein [Clostridia bacterium]|nr:transglutaminase domain-containing protein [Clostridia bacterium]